MRPLPRISSEQAVGMKIRLLVPKVLGKYADGDELAVCFDGNRVDELLLHLRQAYPRLYKNVCNELGELRPHINVFLDKRLLDRRRLDVKLSEDDTVSIFQAVSGG